MFLITLPPFTARTEVAQDVATIRMHGELDMAGVEALNVAVDQARAGGATRIVFDMRDLEFIDSSGVSELLRATHEGYLEGCVIEYLRGPGPVERTLELMRVSELLPLAA